MGKAANQRYGNKVSTKKILTFCAQKCPLDGPYFHFSVFGQTTLFDLIIAAIEKWSADFWYNNKKLEVKFSRIIVGILHFSLYPDGRSLVKYFPNAYLFWTEILLFSSSIMARLGIALFWHRASLTSFFASCSLLFISHQRCNKSFRRAMTSKTVVVATNAFNECGGKTKKKIMEIEAGSQLKRKFSESCLVHQLLQTRCCCKNAVGSFNNIFCQEIYLAVVGEVGSGRVMVKNKVKSKLEMGNEWKNEESQ